MATECDAFIGSRDPLQRFDALAVFDSTGLEREFDAPANFRAVRPTFNVSYFHRPAALCHEQLP